MEVDPVKFRPGLNCLEVPSGTERTTERRAEAEHKTRGPGPEPSTRSVRAEAGVGEPMDGGRCVGHRTLLQVKGRVGEGLR